MTFECDNCGAEKQRMFKICDSCWDDLQNWLSEREPVEQEA